MTSFSRREPRSRAAVIRRLRSRLHKRCEQAFLFGSFARNDQDSERDVDLIVVAKTQHRMPDRVRDFVDVVFDFAPLDLVVLTPEEFARAQKRPPPLIAHARREWVQIV
ncbi:MAG: nucleotidyltransferase domain-containing protein [Myxococcaceae bacterium]